MRALLRAALILCVLIWVPGSATASPGSFVYVTSTTCIIVAGPCTVNLLVYDATTAGLVTTIPISVGRAPFVPGIAISPDGSRLYVSVSVGASPQIVAVDATRHTVIGRFGDGFAGNLAVSHDGTLLFDAIGGMRIYDIASQQLVTSIAAIVGPAGPIAADPVQDRVYWVEEGGSSCFSSTEFRAYDMVLGSTVAVSPTAASPALAWGDLFVSRDDSRLYLSAYGSPCGLHPPGEIQVLNPVSLTVTNDIAMTAMIGSVDSLTRNRVYAWDEFGDLSVLDRDTFATISQAKTVGISSMSVTADEARAYIASPNTLSVMDLGTNQIARTLSVPGLSSRVLTTPPNPAASVCGYRVDTSQSWWSVNGGTASIGLKTNCTWLATSDSTWARLAVPGGAGNATLSLTVDSNYTTTNRTATLIIGGQVVTVTQASFSSTPPFGTVDAPADNATGLSGAISVTGWALDDVGVARVRIYRDPVTGEEAGQQVFIGNATFVDGARPDVQAAYPAFPYASRAGWGLQVLTNMLPNQGNGQFRLYAYADDVDGHTTLLGFKTVTIDNATSILPFGTIDTPGQGDTVSGVVVNFGWALSPALIPVDGSTIDVLIDGVASGHPVYNNLRPDIAALFPNFPNSNGAIGYFVLDTTRLSNGVHTIAWVVRDSNGGAAGIGSRFFTVAN